MDTNIIIFTALLLVAILLYYIYRKDKNSPEPTKELIKGKRTCSQESSK